MPNTINSALFQDSIATQVFTVLRNRLAMLQLFTTDFSSAVKRPKEVIQVPIATAAGNAQINPTNFTATNDTTISNTSVTLDHIYAPFGLSYEDLQNGVRLESLARINLDKMAEAIWARATAPITKANFGAIPTVVAADTAITPTSAHLKTLWAATHKSTGVGLIVNPTIYANLIPVSTQSLPLGMGAYGFSGIYYASSFPSEANLSGFACTPDAIAVASAQPDFSSISNLIESSSVTIPDLGFTLYYNVKVGDNRQLIASFETMFGAAKGLTGGTLAAIYSA